MRQRDMSNTNTTAPVLAVLWSLTADAKAFYPVCKPAPLADIQAAYRLRLAQGDVATDMRIARVGEVPTVR
jgi:hypothetical protein